jgi:hypothetical protein
MSAIFGALALFYALAFVATTLALAADSRPSPWSRSQRTAYYPADPMSDDERTLTTAVAPTTKPAAEAAAKHDSDVAHAA